MAKSTRSKVKRAFRSKKREAGIYAATEAARLNRLNSKLVQITKKNDNVPEVEDEGEEDMSADNDTPQDRTESMVIDATKKVSTHGPRGSRHEEWRKSKGLNPRPSVNSTNRQGVPSGRRKAGRSKRRR